MTGTGALPGTAGGRDSFLGGSKEKGRQIEKYKKTERIQASTLSEVSFKLGLPDCSHEGLTVKHLTLTESRIAVAMQRQKKSIRSPPRSCKSESQATVKCSLISQKSVGVDRQRLSEYITYCVLIG